MKYGCQSWVSKMNSVLIKSPKDAWISQEHLDRNWRDYNYLARPIFSEALKEFQVFEGILKSQVDDVYYLPQDSSVGLDSIYAQDSLKLTNRGAIYFTLGKNLRKNEGLASKKYLESLGIPTLGEIKHPGTMEGGDVLWLGGDTACIGLSYRTNLDGIKQFKNLTQDFISDLIIVPLPHGNGRDEILHLTSLISMIDDDLALVFSEYLPCFFRDYLIARGIKLIEVDRDEYDLLGSNVLAIGPRKCVMLEGLPKVKKSLEEEGCQVFTYPGKNLSLLGMGGPTCLTQPLERVGC